MLGAFGNGDVASVAILTRLVVDGDGGFTFHHDPVLTAVLMALIAQTLPRVYNQTLGFCVRVIDENIETTPRAGFGRYFGSHRVILEQNFHKPELLPRLAQAVTKL